MSDDLVERVARAICYNRAAPACDCRAKGSTCRARVENLMWESNEISSQARVAIAIALKEAAQFVQDECHDYDDAHRIAAAIRAMIKEKNDE
jgi:hypothetical protein